MMQQSDSFQDMVLSLQSFWIQQGCALLQPYDAQKGAATFHPATFLWAIGPEPCYAVYVDACRRPADGRYGENPNRLQHFYQMQVVMKPSPADFQSQYMNSLRVLGIDPLVDDIRFVEDNWKSPTLGAWGLGWEVWQNGMEISQFTYLQQIGGLPCRPVMVEISYGLERMAMYLQGVDNVYDLVWCKNARGTLYYGEIFQNNEKQEAVYNFEKADTDILLQHFADAEKICHTLVEEQLPIPAYDQVLKASHTFNVLDARGVISSTERQRFILRVRRLANKVAKAYYANRQALGFPWLKKVS